MAELTTAASPLPRPSRRARRYRVKDIWKTVQGEGLYAGRPAVFIRLVGCNMWSGYAEDRARDAARTGGACALWCDTDFTREGSTSMTAPDLVRKAAETGGAIRFCVVTGGEPLLQLDAALVRALHAEGFQVAVETNGTVSLREACWDEASEQVVGPDWIVCSPKLPEERLALEVFDELKLVVPSYLPQAYARFAERRRAHEAGGAPLPLLWVQPEDGPRQREATRLAVGLALADPAWRVSVQVHKVLDVD